MRHISYSLVCVVLLSLGIISCTPKFIKKLENQKVTSPSSQVEIDQNLIIDHLIANELDYQKTDSGIFYTITQEGKGGQPQSHSIVKAHYKGTLLNGKQFDSSYDRGEPLKFRLGQVIKGWQEAIQMLSVGSKGTFLIPSHLAYGKRQMGEMIPANSILQFEIELVEFITPE